MADITTRIKLDGEASFRSAIRQATTSVKNLDSELKLAEEKFKDSGDAQQLMADKAAILKQKLDSQKSAVDAAKSAIQQLTERGVDPNSAQMIEWRGKLANAESQVISITREIKNNENGLDSNGRAYTTAGTKAQEMGGKLEDAGGKASDMNSQLAAIGQGISYQNVTDAIDRINTAVSNGIKKVSSLGKSLWSLTVDSTEWADELKTLSTTSGLDTTTLQQWQYAAKFVDTDVETIIAARNKLVRNMDDDSFAETLSGIGVSVTDSEGNLRDSYDVMWDVLGVLGEMSDSTERDNLAMQVFGKSATDLLPLIQAGREEWESYGASAPIVSEENIEKLTAANDAVEDLNSNLETTKRNLLAELAPTLESIATHLTEALQQFNAYLETEEGQEKLQAFSDAAVKLADSILDIDWASAIQTAADALTIVTDALEWIADNKEVVIAALTAIGGLTKEDLESLPYLGSRILRLGQKLGMFKS